MKTIETRLGEIEPIITDKAFRANKGLGNEVGFYIFDYEAKAEIHVRNHIKYLKNKINKSHYDFKIIEFDLYKIVINMLVERGYLEKCFKFEREKGIDFVYEAIISMLRLTEKENLIVNYIIENSTLDSIIFITGVGKCFPIIRSHNILNNLHQNIDSIPVVMFLPGEYTGQDLKLFNSVDDKNYYRAFKLVEK